MNIIAIANQKGGVGKTTSTVTLAGLLAQHGQKTLMVDLDPHGSLSSYFNIDPETVEKSVFNLYQQAAAKQPLATDSIVQQTPFDNLSILPASTPLATLEKQFGGKPGMGLVLLQALKQVQESFEYVLIDCPPMLGMLMINALAACEQLIIPVQTEFLAIKGLQRMLRTMKMIERSLKKKLRYYVLPTLYDQRTRASRQCLQQMQQDYVEHITQTVIPVDTKFRDASFDGKPLSIIYPDTHGVVAYKKLLVEAEIGLNGDDSATNKGKASSADGSFERKAG